MDRPKIPPHISARSTPSPAIQYRMSLPVQNRRMALTHTKRHDHAGQRRPPLFVIRIGRKQHEAMLLADQSPASALPAHRAAGGGIAGRRHPDGVQHRPIQEFNGKRDRSHRRAGRQDRVGPIGEQIGTDPSPRPGLGRKRRRQAWRFQRVLHNRITAPPAAFWRCRIHQGGDRKVDHQKRAHDQSRRIRWLGRYP